MEPDPTYEWQWDCPNCDFTVRSNDKEQFEHWRDVKHPEECESK